MHPWIGSAFAEIMACHLFGVKPLSQPMLGYCQLNHTYRNKLQWNFNQNKKLFIHENASKCNVCKMAAILSRGIWVNVLGAHHIAELLWHVLDGDLAPIPLTIFRSNSKFDQNLQCSGFKIYLTDHNEILHTSQQLHCRDVCKISLWSVEYILNQGTPNLGQISNSIEYLLRDGPLIW